MPRVARSRLIQPFVRILIVLGGCFAAACTPTGDFGRPEPSLLEETVPLWAGRGLALHREEEVSLLPLTDHEKLLREQVYTIVVARDILGRNQSVKPALRYHRILTPTPETSPIDAYFRRQLSIRYQSSDARYDRLLDDIRKDRAVIPPFVAAAKTVIHDDQMRTGGKVDRYADERIHQWAYVRVEENERLIALAIDSLAHRALQYQFAGDQLTLVAPSNDIHRVNRNWSLLSAEIDSADLALRGRGQRNGNRQAPMVLHTPSSGSGAQEYSLARPR